MEIISTKDLKEHLDQEVKLQGWIYNFRSSGKIYFLQFRDGFGFIQAVCEANLVPEDLKMEASVTLVGKVSKHPKKEEYELQVTELKVLQNPKEDYPISKKEHGPDFLLDQRHLWLRSSKQWAVLKVRDTIIHAIFDYFREHDFIKIDTPIFTPNACEGTTELFEVNYFDEDKAYLAQTGQLYLEAAVMSCGKGYDFGPVFRAEKSKTRRHLTEFWMMDAEMAFADHKENMRVQEELLKYVINEVIEKNQEELKILERDLQPLPDFKIVQHEGSEDLGVEEELKITEEAGGPVFVEKYPKDVKAFYMKEDPDDSSRVLCSDLLMPGVGEVAGGSQREDDYEKLLGRIKEEGLPLEDFQWYLDLRKYGSVPHSGFGIGLERLVQWTCGLEHIREAIPFPRLINRLKP